MCGTNVCWSAACSPPAHIVWPVNDFIISKGSLAEKVSPTQSPSLKGEHTQPPSRVLWSPKTTLQTFGFLWRMPSIQSSGYVMGTKRWGSLARGLEEQLVLGLFHSSLARGLLSEKKIWSGDKIRNCRDTPARLWASLQPRRQALPSSAGEAAGRFSPMGPWHEGMEEVKFMALPLSSWRTHESARVSPSHTDNCTAQLEEGKRKL